MSQAPAMPLWCDAYLADTMHLSKEESGCYLTLLMVTWRNNGQPLPDDDKRLARTLAITEVRWKERIRPSLVGFFDLSDGTWRQKRLEKEWNFVAKFKEEQSRKGKLGGRPKLLEINDSEKAEALSRPKPEESPQSHTHSKKEREATASLYSEIEQIDRDGREWYAAFPRKADPGRAAKAYRAARKIASAADLLAGALRYSAECDGKDQQFVKMPATWLNARSWENAPTQPGVNGHGRRTSAADGIAAGFASALAKRADDWGDDIDPAKPLRLV